MAKVPRYLMTYQCDEGTATPFESVEELQKYYSNGDLTLDEKSETWDLYELFGKVLISGPAVVVKITRKDSK